MNNLHVRDTNKKKIINYLYASGGATKQDIAGKLGLSMPTVSLIMKDLQDNGLIRKGKTLKSSGGRKPVVNVPVYGAKTSVGMEITQNHIRLVITDLNEDILSYKKLSEPFQNGDGYFKKLAKLIERFIDESKICRDGLLGVGIALPGTVRADGNILEYSPTLGVRNLPVNTMAEYIPYPVMSDNEANLAGLAEIWKINDLQNAVYLSVNKGVGGAIIINNKLYGGANGRSAEFGHMSIVKDGLQCSCGQKGCLEAYCSTKVLIEPNFADIDDFFTALEAGDRYCMQKWDTYLGYLAIGIDNLRTIFDSDIIIGGEIAGYLEKNPGVLYKKLGPINSFGSSPDYVHFSKYSEKASAVGAAILPVDAFFNS